MLGLDMLGAEVTIPTAGANYTDAKTVTAVQAALVKKGYDLGESGPNKDGVDGLFGSKTKAAIKKMQKNLGVEQTGKIDEGVIMALRVTPGVLPPGVTAAGRAAVQAQVALDAAYKAEHAVTSQDVEFAATETLKATEGAAPPVPSEVLDQARKALTKAKEASTPAQVQAAAVEVKKAAEEVHEAVKPSWFVSPTWAGGPPRWQVGLLAIGTALVIGLVMWAFGGGEPVRGKNESWEAYLARRKMWVDRVNKKKREELMAWRAKRGLDNDWAK